MRKLTIKERAVIGLINLLPWWILQCFPKKTLKKYGEAWYQTHPVPVKITPDRKKLDDYYRFYRPNEKGQVEAEREIETILNRLFNHAKKTGKILALKISHFYIDNKGGKRQWK